MFHSKEKMVEQERYSFVLWILFDSDQWTYKKRKIDRENNWRLKILKFDFTKHIMYTYWMRIK